MIPTKRIRQYSMSSSPVANPCACTLIFSILDTPALSGQGSYHGTASYYLSTLESEGILRVTIKPSSAAFHLHLDVIRTPVVMRLNL